MVRSLIMVWATLATSTLTLGQSPKLVKAILEVESGNCDSPRVGDRTLPQPAYGPLQIRQPVCDDVNKRYHTHYQARAMQGNRSLSLKIFSLYLKMYATKKRLHRVPTDEDYARIWNGGPNGWRSRQTEKYWQKVKLRWH